MALPPRRGADGGGVVGGDAMKIDTHDLFIYFIFDDETQARKWEWLFDFFGCRLVCAGGYDNAWEF